MASKELNPMAEVFGFHVADNSPNAIRYRNQKLCPYNNKVPNCTKDKANNPLGVCSIIHNNNPIITCPIRFRQDWLIIDKAAEFFFGEKSLWTSLTEIKLLDKHGLTAGNIDFVLVSYDANGKLIDFASLEIQGVYISGNLRNPFEEFIKNPTANLKWATGYNYPKPDFLSSSRKRLLPQLLYKGGIFKAWGKKQGVALQKAFFDTLPKLPQVSEENADICWFLYDIVYNEASNNYKLVHIESVYTEFESALKKIANPDVGDISNFIGKLQEKLDERLEGNAPDTPSLNEILQ